MKKHRVKTINDPIYSKLNQLYEISFPLHEKRTAEHQLTALKNDLYHLICFIEQEELVGFVGLWDFADYVYIEHYAINSALRGKGYGTLLLETLLSETDKTVILEIDPVVDTVSEKRLRFYRKLGFVENAYPHEHPPYREGFQPHSLTVLSSGKPIAEREYRRFKRDLDDIVMFKE